VSSGRDGLATSFLAGRATPLSFFDANESCEHPNPLLIEFPDNEVAGSTSNKAVPGHTHSKKHSKTPWLHAKR
ncbi:MAG TPA: hypothetical protein VGP47_04450, partial [Parachlamydiaceae bacterium]|nr:hypothetical protein [Parachlamydiaceae bacterium]